MAKKKRAGFRAARDYDPNRGQRSAKRRTHRRERGTSAGDTELPARFERAARSHAGPVKDGAGGHAPRVRTFDRHGVERRKDKRATASPQSEEPAIRTNTQIVAAEVDADHAFSDLGLGNNLIRALAELGAERPFAIQAATIPPIIRGENVLGRARTGSGKTIAFGVGLVERLLRLKASGAFARDPARERSQTLKRGQRAVKQRTPVRKPKALVLAPTRELALQLDRTIQPLARSVGFFTAQLYGGVPQATQVTALQRGIDIVIGTPGRIEDLVRQRHLDLRDVRVSVVDEADHMCDLGFLEPVQRILRHPVRGTQMLLFSATLDTQVSTLVREFMAQHVAFEVADEARDAARVDHRVFVVRREDKERVLVDLADTPGKVLVFARTRNYAENVAQLLEDHGLAVTVLHGDLSQSRRERNLDRFHSGRADVLVATDVAARGLHIDDVALVLQADPPGDFKTYLHRAGRTGRAGMTGTVATLIPQSREGSTQELLDQAGIVASYFGTYSKN